MRALPPVLLAVFLLTLPSVSAEWGAYGADGWPINVDGETTNPYPGSILELPSGPVNEVAGVTLYPYYPVLTAEVQQIAADHPDLVRLHSIGKSTLGLDLWMLEVADFQRIEAGDGLPLDAREVVWIDGGTHSNEYSGVYFVAHLARFLTDEYETNDTARWIVENRHTWLMPMVNPDGSNAFGRLNANLVNINRNYPVVWDGVGHDPVMNNRGDHPASEVETQINIEWFNKTQPDYYASVHCCGNLWLYPYGEEGVDPVDNETLSRVCIEAFPSVGDACGPIWSTIYPASGSSVDTVYEYTGAVAFGYEMSGRGAVSFWGQPFTVESVRVQEVESWEGVLHGFRNVHRYGAYPELTAARAVLEGLEVVVQNTGYGPANGTTITYHTSGTTRTIDLPLLLPGEDVVAMLPATLEAGIFDVQVDYTKRMQASPLGHRTIPILLVDGSDGPEVDAFGDDVLRVDLTERLEEEMPLRLAPLLAALAVALALSGMRRRR